MLEHLAFRRSSRFDPQTDLLGSSVKARRSYSSMSKPVGARRRNFAINVGCAPQTGR
jgi:hypothetical protein